MVCGKIVRETSLWYEQSEDMTNFDASKISPYSANHQKNSSRTESCSGARWSKFSLTAETSNVRHKIRSATCKATKEHLHDNIFPISARRISFDITQSRSVVLTSPHPTSGSRALYTLRNINQGIDCSESQTQQSTAAMSNSSCLTRELHLSVEDDVGEIYCTSCATLDLKIDEAW